MFRSKICWRITGALIGALPTFAGGVAYCVEELDDSHQPICSSMVGLVTAVAAGVGLLLGGCCHSRRYPVVRLSGSDPLRHILTEIEMEDRPQWLGHHDASGLTHG